MKILFDVNVPDKLRKFLSGHLIIKARDMGWGKLPDSLLLPFAEQNGFEVLITTDQNIPYQQNLQGRRLAILILMTTDWSLIRRGVGLVMDALTRATPGSLQRIGIHES